MKCCRWENTNLPLHLKSSSKTEESAFNVCSSLLTFLALHTEGYSGADIAQLCRRALQEVLSIYYFGITVKSTHLNLLASIFKFFRVDKNWTYDPILY